MSFIVEQQLQAARHAAADVRDVFEVSSSPLLSNHLLHFFQCLGEARVDTGLEHVPQVLDGVEVRAPGRSLDERYSLLVEIGDCLRSGVEANIVLLEVPRARRIELAERLDEAVSQNITIGCGVERASIEFGVT